MFQPKFPPAFGYLPLIHQGKTRDTFPTSADDELLIVATRRLSTHNVVHKSEVPFKDQVLTALTIFWAEFFQEAGIDSHLLSYGTSIYKHLPGTRDNYPADLHHRAIVVKRLKMIPIEFILRGYLTGSLYKKYYSKNLPNPYGISLEPGLPLMHPFNDAPLFTPTDKSETDEPLNSATIRRDFPEATEISEKVFLRARDFLRACHLDLVDTKLELGIDKHGKIIVGDEIVTPDSSRFCELSQIKVGVDPDWLDKQIARDEAEKVWGPGGLQIPLEFRPEIIDKLSQTQLEIFRRITGMQLGEFQAKRLA